ncbi:hypothetical protein RB614_37035 [Phytohabitans sp. ZYX-F-186]|uniref:Secreted protein n=1 Tax=Phytohabitans maris TaxID=3071409 RepID=A0ABU0ZVY2_9ACTN|nr:hypothetical protein [Phytohabitans sp. ZYX-F-186]MDQ7910117.1 hypothetical protein [Phytohabitans sp. ZYX-F-186]
MPWRLRRASPTPFIVALTSSGVSTMPATLENEALKMAAGTLPPAIEVSAIALCTVDGAAQRTSRPCWSWGSSTVEGSSASSNPNAGKSAMVVSSTARCSRQCEAPARASRGEIRAP